MPKRRLLLQLFNEAGHLLVFVLTQSDAETGRDILIFGVAVAGAGLGRHHDQMPHHPRQRALGKRVKARDRLAGDLPPFKRP